MLLQVGGARELISESCS
uniref:Uncharacterized protein n=1 Tax=Anguilla anguilla TaxID=7936 RepID=A0A0E9TPU2_ANGAN